MEAQGILSEHQEMLFHSECDWALAWVALRVCGTSTLGDSRNLYEHGPGKLPVDAPAWSEILDQMASWGPIQPELFCGSVKGIKALQLIRAELQTEWRFNEWVECYEK